MKITYKNKKLEKICSSSKEARRAYGDKVSSKLAGVMQLLESATSLADLKPLPPLRLHMLVGDRKGTYSISLGKKLGFRLLFKGFDNEGCQVLSDSMESCVKVVIVLLEEVSNHYD